MAIYSLRSEYTENRYQKFLNDDTKGEGCIFCQKDLLIREFDNWVLLQNRYPYDAVFKVHHMLAPKRHVTSERGLTPQEAQEYRNILDELQDFYHCSWFNFPSRQTIPSHYHIHLLQFQ